uniref:Histidine ammonia-lyase n=1 Tax=Hydra vulgaris TaxID=6087 RepID=T2MG95_HYDVU
MKIFVNYFGVCYTVPCGNGDEIVSWLIDETLKRKTKTFENSTDEEVLLEEKTLFLRHSKHFGILNKDDKIKDILDDGDLVHLKNLKVDNIFNTTTNEHDHSKADNWSSSRKVLFVDGNSLSTKELVDCGKGKFVIKLTENARHRVQKARDLINDIVREHKVVYGVTTGFGNFANVVISEENLKQVQLNLIRSHASCVGEPLTLERSRSLLALRINVLAKGYSGISVENLEKLIDVFNSGCISKIPQKGTVGASGDLGPLSHLVLGLLGEGSMWGPKTGWTDASTVLTVHGLKKLDLGPKEGLALINGTQMMTALGCEAVERAKAICKQADIVAALSIEVLKGTTKAFNEEIHNTRPHKGQILVASRLRSLLHSKVYHSEVAESHRFCGKVQDAYTLRCCPQVHGIVNDTVEFVNNVLTVECNSATDNPMVFADLGETVSGGNFHGEYPAKVLDYLAIGIHELANMSERRLERLINPNYSDLPAFLVNNGGLNSGFMLAQCTAAALVSENKVLTHPSSVDSLTTSAGTEDHVSMGGFAARKAIDVVEHVEYVLAIELLAACQGLEFLRPLKCTEPLEAVYRTVRSVVRAYDTDRFMAPDIEAAVKLLQEEKVWNVVEPYIQHYNIEMEKKNEECFVQPDSPSSYMVDSPSCASPPSKKKK